jgi:hypothetical protein
MKKKQSVRFGFAVLVITAIFTIGSCEQSTDEENDDGGTPQTTTRSPLPLIALLGFLWIQI